VERENTSAFGCLVPLRRKDVSGVLTMPNLSVKPNDTLNKLLLGGTAGVFYCGKDQRLQCPVIVYIMNMNNL